MICKFCNNNDVIQYKSINSPYYPDKKYILYECKHCLSRFFDVYQYGISIDKLYENLATSKKNLSIRFLKSQYWEDQKRKILQLLKIRPRSILDVGCRTGDFLMHFEDTIIREGVEISNYCTEIANKRGLRIYNENLESINFNQKYDIVSAYNILEHLIDPLSFLDKLSSVINKNGVLAILIPSHESLREKLLTRFHKKWHMYVPPEHLNFFSKRFLDFYLSKHDFKLLERYYSSGGIFNPFKGIPFINALFNKFMYFIDKSPFNKLPIFDHLFSYYLKIK
jgi:SAM-dependent methyltransferase